MQKWDDVLVENRLKIVVDELNLDRFPTKSEMDEVEKSAGLSNKVAQKGFRTWAEHLGLSLKDCSVTKGHEWEYKIKELIEQWGYKVEKMTLKHPYDLLVNENIKVDVKASKVYKSNNCKYHTFNLEKKHHNCDIFICVCLDEASNVQKTLVIPSKYLMGKNQLSVGFDSKYNKFNNKFKYILDYNTFYKDIL